MEIFGQEIKKTTKVLKRSLGNQVPKASKKSDSKNYKPRSIEKVVEKNSDSGGDSSSSDEPPLLVSLLCDKPVVQKKPEYSGLKPDEDPVELPRHINSQRLFGAPVGQDTKYDCGWLDFSYAALNVYTQPKPDKLSEFDKRLADIDGDYIL
mgnify:CR=1 FL=1